MDLTGWTPVRVRFGEGGAPVVDWCFTAGVPFADPTFDQTVERCFCHPFRLLFRWETGMDDVRRFVADHPGLPPAGFVFHLSRCGSTLVSQMLAAVPTHLVVAEAGPLDSVLRVHADPGERATWLRWMVGALGQPRDERQRRLFVKFDAWSTLDLDVVRLAFPDVPWMFLYRDPVEVLVSHARRPGAHLIPGAVPGLAPSGLREEPGSSLLDHGVRVLAAIGQAAVDHRHDPGVTFVEYGQLPGFVVEELAEAWSLTLGPDDVARMVDVARQNAKNPVLAHEADGPAKQAAATPDLRAAAERWLAPVYDRLEAARKVIVAG